MPNGRHASRWRIERGLRLARVLLGMDAEVELRARVRRDGVQAFSTDGTSIPVTVIAGPDQTREPSPPVPTSGSPGSDLGELAELVLAVRGARPLLAPQPVDGDVAVLVVQRGERVQQRR